MTPDHDGKALEQLRKLAAVYTPEWRFDPEQPDSGAALALLISGMLSDSASRFDKVLHKHKIQYLNLFDRLKEEPVEAARSYVRFHTVPGLEEPVFVPKSTRLLANSRSGQHTVTFETAYGITACDAELETVFVTDRDRDIIAEVAGGRTGSTAERCHFAAFGTDYANQAEHRLLLGYDNLLDGLGSLRLHLELSGEDVEAVELAVAELLSPGVRFTLLGGEDPISFDRVEREGDTGILLVKENAEPVKTQLAARQCYVLCLSADAPTDMELPGIGIRLSAEELEPDSVSVGGIAQNPRHLLPFGEPMEIYSECVLESREAFSRRGAMVTLRFDLSFQVLERLLPELEEDPNYKVVMKRPRTQPKPTVAEVRADYVLFEYLTPFGWKRLIKEEHMSALFNGSAEGELLVSFQLPEDILSYEEAEGQGRIRIRLLRADNLYQIPSRQSCPVLDNLRLSYRYDEAVVLPDYACTRNNFEVREVTDRLRNSRSFHPFYNKEEQRPALYLGFSAPCRGTPLSLYWQIENNADQAVDFTAEYLAPGGFRPIKLVDNTGGMLYSETMLLVVPSDLQRSELFGRNFYWLRLLCHGETEQLHRLPVVSGIYTNMAKVENVVTRTEEFYVDDLDRTVDIRLAEQNLLEVKVLVNEAEGAGTRGENWVAWHKSQHRRDRGRVYELDLVGGEIHFQKGVFASYPLLGGGADIRVEYRSYHGSEANVDALAINSMSTAIRYISRAENPMPAYGGYDGYSEETSQAIIANLLRTRGRAVTERDYADIISQLSYSVRRVKVVSGIGLSGEREEDALTIAVLTLEYEKGGHVFSAVKDSIRQSLIQCSDLLPMGRRLILSQPHFVRFSVRLWLECERMEGAYDLQKECENSVRTFIDPLTGGFEGRGWEIGALPGRQQLLAYLKIRHPDITVGRLVVTARFGEREFAVEDNATRQIDNPFAMAVNGEHVIYVELAENSAG
ncbi:MAG: hypothetical protein ACK5LX_16990 [Oscillospiraceae bacterium]